MTQPTASRASIPHVYLNGSFIEKGAAVVPVDDRGFIFGDGVYEVWRVVEGVLFEVERHRSRLVDGLRQLDIAAPPEVAAERFAEIAERLLAVNGLTSGQATLYIEITRGAAPRTHYYPPAGTPPTVYMTAARFAPNDVLRASGARAITMPDVRWLRCDLKTIQLLPNVLGKQRAISAGAIEAIFVRDGVLTEGSHTNVFGVIDGTLRTHRADHLVLPGVTREVVLEIAATQRIPVSEEGISVEELPGADEVFLTGTTMDVLPIIRVDDRTVGNGRPGPIAISLYDALAERLTGGRPALAR